ncbi:MAG: hypothetical protein HQK97_09580, partial [Nitrospirae bacterium]|nr:hypothetical protein [Nitrospirota bacterium]
MLNSKKLLGVALTLVIVLSLTCANAFACTEGCIKNGMVVQSSTANAQADTNIPLTTSAWRQSDACGQVTVSLASDGIYVNGAGFRVCGAMQTTSAYNVQGSQLYIKWRGSGAGTYGGVAIFLESDPKAQSSDYAKVVWDKTFAWSYMGSVVISDNTWYYARVTFNSDNTTTSVISTGNYDDQGGTVFATESGTYKSADSSYIFAMVGDNYGGTSAYIEIGEAKIVSPVAAEFKTFNNSGAFGRYALLEDSSGNLYFSYGNAAQLRYAEYMSNTDSWSDTLIDNRSKSVNTTSTVLDTKGNKWVFTEDGNDSIGDSTIFKNAAGHWSKATDLYSNTSWGWDAGPYNDRAFTMIKDANNNLHVLFQKYGDCPYPWDACGHPAEEMIYNTNSSSLSGLVTISDRESQYIHAWRNYAYSVMVLSANGTIYVPMWDCGQYACWGDSFFIGKSASYGTWDVSTGVGGGYKPGVSYEDEFGNWHTVYNDGNNVYYGLNFGTPQLIYQSSGNIVYYSTDIIAVNNIVYISTWQYDTITATRGNYYSIVRNSDGTWTAPKQMTNETSFVWQAGISDGFVKKAHPNIFIPSVYFAYASSNGNSKILKLSSSTVYTVTPSAGANGTISPATPQAVASGATKQFTITPNSGYLAAVGGTCGGTLSGNVYTTSAIKANCTVAATFTRTSYTVTPSAGANGTISPATPQTVTAGIGATKQFTVTPNSGYIATVGGTCGGNLSGNVYTTSA